MWRLSVSDSCHVSEVWYRSNHEATAEAWVDSGFGVDIRRTHRPEYDE